MEFPLPFGLEMHEAAWIVAGVFAGLSILVAFYSIFGHLRHYTEPNVQRYMVRIILMIPIYATDSYLALIIRHYAFYLNLFRDCYEAYVLYMFFRLLVELADGDKNLADSLEEVPQMKYSLPFCCFHIKPGRIFLHRCKQMILQFVVVKPILSVITFILEITDSYGEGDLSPKYGFLYISILYNFSITISLYFLVLFYEATKGILAEFKPISKFLCIKSIIFFSFWQAVVIAVCVFFNFLFKATDEWTISDISTATQNFLICVEMLPCSLAFAFTFGYKSFKDPNASTKIISAEAATDLVKNFTDVANVGDVVEDTRSAMRKDPNRKRVEELDHFFTLEEEDKRYYTIHHGWVDKKGDDLVKNWKKRFLLCLKHPHGLAYLKMDPFRPDAETVVKARGWIPITSIVAILAKTNEQFNIKTNNRTFRFKCKSKQERDEWIKIISAQLPEFSSVALE